MERECAYEPCGVIFTARTHNQIYCSADHRSKASNIKTLANYHASRARRRGPVRICETPGCTVQLNKYNQSRVCGKCDNREAVEREETRKRLLELLSS